ncbi:MAG: hypothetical protein ACRDJW_08915 [Thermomicrobiales bacterium]
MAHRTSATDDDPDAPKNEAAAGSDSGRLAGQTPPDQRHSTGGDLLRFAGTWVGDDFEECLEAVYASRGQISFETWEEDMTPTTSSAAKHRSSTNDPETSPHIKCEAADSKGQRPVGVPASALLAHFGRWQGDDLEELTAEVYRTRSKVRF